MMMVLLVALAMLNATYSMQSVKTVLNEYTGISEHAPPLDPTPTHPPTQPPTQPPTHPPTHPPTQSPTQTPTQPAIPGDPRNIDDIDIPGRATDTGDSGKAAVLGNPPQTGDETDARPWLIMLAVCTYILRYVLFIKKERGNEAKDGY
jgi:hypothetical protein